MSDLAGTVRPGRPPCATDFAHGWDGMPAATQPRKYAPYRLTGLYGDPPLL